MSYLCRQQIVPQLKDCAKSNRHSIVIEGPKGCGKTKLASMYADCLNIPDFYVVLPTVNDIRSAVDECSNMANPVVLCIENLDTGVISSAYTLLKFLEEPPAHVYIVVTCINIAKVPETILSRSITLTAPAPHKQDIDTYAESLDAEKFRQYSSYPIWKSAASFSDVDTIFNLSLEQIRYIEQLTPDNLFKDAVTNIVWKLGHFPDNSATPIELVINYIISCAPQSSVLQQAAIECMTDIIKGSIAAHTAITKFAFTGKYVE